MNNNIKDTINTLREILNCPKELRIGQYILNKLPYLYYINKDNINNINNLYKNGHIESNNLKELLRKTITVNDYNKINDIEFLSFFKISGEDKVFKIREILQVPDNRFILQHLLKKHIIKIIFNDNLFSGINKGLKKGESFEISETLIKNLFIVNDFYHLSDDIFISGILNNKDYSYNTF